MLHNGQKFPKNASFDNISGKYQNTLKMSIQNSGKMLKWDLFLTILSRVIGAAWSAFSS